VPPDGVDFIDKDDARRSFCPDEQITREAPTPTNISTIGTADAENGTLRRHWREPKGFAGSRAPTSKHPLNSAAELGEFFGSLRKTMICRSSLASSTPATSLKVTLLIFRKAVLRGLAKGHRLATARLHLAHKNIHTPIRAAWETS
jgi:hypothetical protein